MSAYGGTAAPRKSGETRANRPRQPVKRPSRRTFPRDFQPGTATAGEAATKISAVVLTDELAKF